MQFSCDFCLSPVCDSVHDNISESAGCGHLFLLMPLQDSLQAPPLPKQNSHPGESPSQGDLLLNFGFPRISVTAEARDFKFCEHIQGWGP